MHAYIDLDAFFCRHLDLCFRDGFLRKNKSKTQMCKTTNNNRVILFIVVSCKSCLLRLISVELFFLGRFTCDLEQWLQEMTPVTSFIQNNYITCGYMIALFTTTISVCGMLP